MQIVKNSSFLATIREKDQKNIAFTKTEILFLLSARQKLIRLYLFKVVLLFIGGLYYRASWEEVDGGGG